MEIELIKTANFIKQDKQSLIKVFKLSTTVKVEDKGFVIFQKKY